MRSMPMQRLVVVIPGIGGSILRDPESGDTVWSHGTGALAQTFVHPDRLDLSRPLTPAGLLQDVQALPGWTVLQGYTALWNRLSGIPGAVPDDATATVSDPGANLIAFPYDFRQSIRQTAAELDRRVRDQLRMLGRQDAPDSVIVVAHSLGGLIARYWIARLGGHELCHGLITLGTPHRGAPKALDVFANGLHVRTRLGSAPIHGMSAQLRTWPSFQELLPRYPCIKHPDHPGQGVRVGELDQFDARWNSLAAAGRNAYVVSQEIQDGWAALPHRPRFRVRSGVVQPTLQSATLTHDRLEVSELAPLWLDLGIFADDGGDATVPAISAFPIEVEDEGTYDDVVSLTPVTHGRIGNDEAAVRFVERCEGFPTRTAARGQVRWVGLGLDVPELVTSEAPVQARIRFHGVGLERPDDQPVYVAARAAAGTNRGTHAVPVRAEWDPGTSEFVAELAGLSAGIWTVSAEGRSVPRAGDLRIDREVAVVGVEGGGW